MTKSSTDAPPALQVNLSFKPDNSNLQAVWSPKNVHQPKYCNRKTYIDDVQRISKKTGSSSPNKYNLSMEWTKSSEKPKSIISDKTNFVDTCQYYSEKTPGPGSYIIATVIAKQKKQAKFTPHQPLQAKENSKADMNTYNPCPADYNTFMRYSIMPKQQKIIEKKIK